MAYRAKLPTKNEARISRLKKMVLNLIKLGKVLRLLQQMWKLILTMGKQLEFLFLNHY
jgi:hypothetical protein